MKRVATTAWVVVVVLVPILAVVGDTSLVVAVHEQTSSDLAKEEVRSVQAYVTGASSTLPDELSARAEKHLRDVRGLVTIAWWMALISFFIGVTMSFDRSVALRDAALLGASAYVVVAVISTVSFDTAFYVFHEALFDGSSYVFPSDSSLITWFPVTFFHRCASFIAAYALCLATGLVAAHNVFRRA